MQAFFWYGIALASVVVALILRRARGKLMSIAQWAASRVGPRVLLPRGPWSSITIGVPDAIVLSLFLAANVLLSLTGQNTANLAIINLLPLFLGGRTNYQADYLGVSLPVYQLAHQWVARVFAFQALLHSGLRWSHASGVGWVIGVAVAGLIIANLVTSLLPIRRWAPSLFRWIHLVLSLTILCGVSIHAILLAGLSSFPAILCITAAGLFTVSWVFRLGRQLYQGQAEVIHYEVLDHAVRLWVRARHAVPTRAGVYFYVRFSNLSLRARFQSRLLPVAFWKTASRESAQDISFLVPYSHDLASFLQHKRTLRVRLDGPYGQRLELGDYELVILVADGEGIAGVLPLALSILSRRKWDEEDKAQRLSSKLYRDRTRKVDLIWRLQDNKQVEWASSYFASLAGMELTTTGEKKRRLARSLLMVWVLYPDNFVPGIHVPREKAWMECQTSAEQYPDLLSGLILKESSRTPGESIVITCGAASFVQQTRVAVRRSRATAVTFKELEYQPSSTRPSTVQPTLGRTLHKTAAARKSVAQALQKQLRSNRSARAVPAHGEGHRRAMDARAVRLASVNKPLPVIRGKEVVGVDRRRVRGLAVNPDHGLSLTVND